ncbi:hypothetical protein MmTuc01_0715 [Methanosarcina mazei Tuc01]|uniref:Uncharacterized protein n=1 Tax=Methanosarcina mazei Tuc01 TaxID=1236903 RepID=M1PV68_METMZ|nr:hypothetical protein MmTuc01_0715 [Methanosarcina mazei Tuc01]
MFFVFPDFYGFILLFRESRECALSPESRFSGLMVRWLILYSLSSFTCRG